MSDGPDADDESSGFPTCPKCGEPVTNTTIIGPMEASAGPCGCRVPPKPLTDSERD